VINTGPTLAVFDRWHSRPALRWLKRIPYYQSATFQPVHEDVTGADIDEEGEYVFVAYGIKDYSVKYLMPGDTRLPSRYDGTNGWVRVYRKSDGECIGRCVPGPELNHESGWIDIQEGLNVHRRASGEYLILVEEDWKNRNILYRWCPTDDCSDPVPPPVEDFTRFRIEGSFPNPFHTSTRIQFSLAEASRVRIRIYDTLGRTVTTLADRLFTAGAHGVDWPSPDDAGNRRPGGIYLCRLEAFAENTPAAFFQGVQKLVLY
jgi:hypothetical protein